MAQKTSRGASRAVYGAFVLLTTLFVGSITYQVARQVFVLGAPSGPPPSPACASGLRELRAAVDRGLSAALAEPRVDSDEAAERYHDASAAAWARREAVAAACAGDPGGLDAIAAVARLDRRAEGIVRRQTSELRAVRHEVDSFIR